MRRADRLFQIVQRLRKRGATTARSMADALEVSERTIYRDVQDLIRSGVPILGEAGVGYALPRGFDLPPLMFTEEEVEALVLGARMVESWSDAGLARAAQGVLAKVEAVLPPRLKQRLDEAHLFAPGFHLGDRRPLNLTELREAIRERRKLRFRYTDRAEAPSARTVQPLGLFFWGKQWSLAGWCELREGFRNFRLDRISALERLEDVFVSQPGRTLRDLMAYYEREGSARKAAGQIYPAPTRDGSDSSESIERSPGIPRPTK